MVHWCEREEKGKKRDGRRPSGTTERKGGRGSGVGTAWRENRGRERGDQARAAPLPRDRGGRGA
jgi:hypothetical protein